MANSNRKIQGYNNGVFWERNTLPEQNTLKNKASVNNPDTDICQSGQLSIFEEN